MADFARAMAMIIRAQLFGPDNHIVPDSQYNELFAMHGTIMLLFATGPRRRAVAGGCRCRRITRFDGVRCGLGMCDVGTPYRSSTNTNRRP
jgi:hypothetical protein